MSTIHKNWLSTIRVAEPVLINRNSIEFGAKILDRSNPLLSILHNRGRALQELYLCTLQINKILVNKMEYVVCYLGECGAQPG